MTNLDDLDYASFVVYCVDHSVGTLADSIALFVSGELLATAGTRCLSEGFDSGNDTGADATRLHGFELLRRGRLDENAIACHAAEEP